MVAFGGLDDGTERALDGEGALAARGLVEADGALAASEGWLEVTAGLVTDALAAGRTAAADAEGAIERIDTGALATEGGAVGVDAAEGEPIGVGPMPFASSQERNCGIRSRASKTAIATMASVKRSTIHPRPRRRGTPAAARDASLGGAPAASATGSS